MNRWLLAVLLVAPVFAGAQIPTSVALTAGMHNFGTRVIGGGARHRYSGSMEFEVRGERAISRRFGVMLAAMAAPLSAQRTEGAACNAECERAGGGETRIFAPVRAFGAEAALSFRFKPAAPIYFYCGAAYMRFSLFADVLDAPRPATDIGVATGFGLDQKVSDRYNLRFQFAWNMMRPDAPPPPTLNSPKSFTRDFRLSIGVRRTFIHK